jgi:hypothetical protein
LTSMTSYTWIPARSTSVPERPGTFRPLPALAQGGLIALLLVLAVIGWVVTDERMAGMDAGPGTDPGALGFYVTAWVVMMAAMMFPSIAPMVLVHARLKRGRREHGSHPAAGTATFVAGYLVTWTAAGLLGFVLIKAGRTLEIGALSWSEAGPVRGRRRDYRGRDLPDDAAEERVSS